MDRGTTAEDRLVRAAAGADPGGAGPAVGRAPGRTSGSTEGAIAAGGTNPGMVAVPGKAGPEPDGALGHREGDGRALQRQQEIDRQLSEVDALQRQAQTVVDP